MIILQQDNIRHMLMEMYWDATLVVESIENGSILDDDLLIVEFWMQKQSLRPRPYEDYWSL